MHTTQVFLCFFSRFLLFLSFGWQKRTLEDPDYTESPTKKQPRPLASVPLQSQGRNTEGTSVGVTRGQIVGSCST